MSLQLPNLDDRRYEDLVAEAISLIPTYAPEWTNHNPSDPGVTLVELFAYLSDMLIYRINRVTSRNVLSFLKLLNGTNWDPFTDKPDEKELSGPEKQAITQKLNDLPDDELRQLVARQLPLAIKRLRKLERAVSREDFETLALEASPDAARARCLPRRNLDVDLEGEREGHVSVIVLPTIKAETEGKIADVISAVNKYLAPKLLLTTRLHVVKAIFVGLTIETSVALRPDQKQESGNDRDNITARIRQEVERFFNPRPDPARNTPGWPFGRNIFASEVYALLDQLPFVDYVTDVKLTANRPNRELPNGVGIEVKPYELVGVENVKVNVTGMQI
jgi:hypothetical protein